MVIGLTGAIASGKSLVSSEFKRLGAHVIDADLIAREIVEPGMPVYNEIIAEFGDEVRRPDGTLDRKRLGQIIFSDSDKRELLNRITHPAIIERIDADVRRIKERYPDDMIVVDAALIIELGLNKKMDRVVVVYADEETCVERVRMRDGLSESEARERLQAQMPLKEKLGYADYIIGNSGEIEETRKRTAEVFAALSSEGKQAGKKQP